MLLPLQRPRNERCTRLPTALQRLRFFSSARLCTVAEVALKLLFSNNQDPLLAVSNRECLRLIAGNRSLRIGGLVLNGLTCLLLQLCATEWFTLCAIEMVSAVRPDFASPDLNLLGVNVIVCENIFFLLRDYYCYHYL